MDKLGEAIMTKSNYFSAINFFTFMSIVAFATLTALSAACNSAAQSDTVEAAKVPSVGVEKKQQNTGFDHSVFESLLQSYADSDGKVDYDGFAKDRAKLDAYLKSLGDADIAAFTTDDERNAFHINAYNAFTIRDVLDDVYKKTDSVKKVDGFLGQEKTSDRR